MVDETLGTIKISRGRIKFSGVPGLDTEFDSIIKQITGLFGRVDAILSQEHYDDFSVPLTRDKQGQSQKPDYDFNELGLLFPQNDATEEIYLVNQMSHTKKLWSDIYLHVHYVQASANTPIYEVSYRFYNNGAIVPSTWTTIDTSAKRKVFPYPGSGSILQICAFPTIKAPKVELLSANLDMKFRRKSGVSNDVTGDVLTKFVDFHFKKNSDGSREPFNK